MAEAVLFGVAQEIITNLGSQAIQEIGQWWGFKDELEKLNRTVSTIKGVLRHAEEKSLEDDTQVKEWLEMLKEAFYDADDLLDEASADALRQQVMTGNNIVKEVRRFFSSSNRLAYGRKMSRKIRAIRNRLEEVAGNRRFHLEERSEERIFKAKGRETHSSPPEVVIGREEDKEAIIQLLLSSNCQKNVSIIPIVGIGGLGKTTLAQHVYNDDRVKMHFELRKWACISDDFDIKSIVERLVVEPRSVQMEALKNLLHREINGKKYLMVLDDIWSHNSQKWSGLMDLLVGGARGSKIIITTRLKNVGEMTRPVAIHELKGLSDTESWSLFKEIALKPGQVLSPSHESIGKEIVAKCLGVPLAIKTMGGLLYSKDSSGWLSFNDKELSKIKQEEGDILPTLKLSYSHLPLHLKQCFSYCKLFPKDYRIEVEMLIQLWIAQGYVKSSDPSESLEEIGVQYFTDLYWGSFFQEVEKDDFGNYKTCKMHDLMHDVATLVAGEECASSSNSEVGISNAKTRHASFHQYYEVVSPSLLKAHKLRTLLLSKRRRSDIIEPCCEIFSNLRCLRVLGLPALGTGSLPGSIDKMKHLRYLDLSESIPMMTLPDSITNLPNLQVLKLNGCGNLSQLPSDMKKLVNLTHLENERFSNLTHMPRGIGQLTSLEKLSVFLVARDSSDSKLVAGLSELHGLNKLRGSLRITNLKRVVNCAIECKAANLKEKKHLQNLELDWDCFNYYKACEREVENEEMALEALEPHQYLKGLSVSDYRGVKLPSWLSSLTNLVDISFDKCCNIKCLPLSHQLPFLKKIRIFDLANLEYIQVGDCDCDYEGGTSLLFPSLQQIQMYICPNLKGWNVEKLQFPCLSDLTISYCPNLKGWMPRSPSLKKLWYVGSTAKCFEQILETATMALESTSSSSSSSELEDLTIVGIEDLEFLPMVLLSNLTSLQHLVIRSCSGITSLSGDDEGDAMQWQGLKSLLSLKLRYLPNLVSLPMGLQYLTSLRRLKISKCSKLMSLPDCMRSFSSLQNLHITKCPELSIRCDNNTAEDWPKIAHIPDIQIDSKIIQSNGRYLL